ncbi:alpha-D-ribose 1-methylphosphonate 5-triphosphate diphosphatase [Meiothermus sp. CFH 77666]|uniref:alpha-D-ribose 1-methylphosphonate 5-triphosphate diphosphatase n=1 Tax=Meiothermus sp. CFH 77666 TaxID=2817942 RepID=UPI001AA054EB|nr:alpha-D-ribose 1-methylphosphonate 5-triphosphate diphosphatase [Meiothermus sp. CFH 77666]
MWIKNLKLVLPQETLPRGSICLEDGRISAIVEGDAPNALDGRGLTAIPGLIDMHGDMLERELQPHPGSRFPIELALYELDKRLVGSGITTAYASISFIEGWGSRDPQEGLEIIQSIHCYRERLLCDLKVHARFEVTTPRSAPILQEGVANDEIHLVSLMDHSPGQGQFRDLEHYVEYYSKWMRGYDESEAQIRARAQHLLEAPRAWHIAREVAWVALTKGIALASHDDDTREKVDLMGSLGASISEFPVTLEAAQEAKRRGMGVVMGAPNAYRGSSHSGNLSALEGIQAGVVDGLASDYHPASLLQSVFKLEREGVLSLPQAVALATQNIAWMCGLGDRGRLVEGLRADLVLVEEGPCPRVRATFVAGQAVYSDGTLG